MVTPQCCSRVCLHVARGGVRADEVRVEQLRAAVFLRGVL